MDKDKTGFTKHREIKSGKRERISFIKKKT